MRKKTGNNQFLKQFNKAVILDLIRTNKSMSKIQLAESTGLSPTAVGVITSSLLEDGYIYETGIGESKGGRRPVLLELKPKYFYSIGIEIDLKYVNIVLVDTTGEVISENQTKIAGDMQFTSILDIIESEIKKTLKLNFVLIEKLLGIGVSVPGLVNSYTGEIILAPNLGWECVDIKSKLQEIFKVPVYVENEAMSSAICENWIGLCHGTDNFVCINIKSGIGAGIFANGKIYRGAGGSAGEVGHIVVDESGPKCGCGNYGCLETVASTAAIVENAKKIVRQGVDSILNNVEDIEKLDIDYIIESARNGDEASKGVLIESARYVGIAISNIVNTLNPSKIVLGKSFIKYADLVMESIKSIVARKSLKAPASKVEIMASEIGEMSSTLGAAIIPLKVLFGK